MVRRVGGWWALLSIWVLTWAPAAFSAYIVRTIFSERWPGTDVTAVMESIPAALAVWAAVTIALTVWGVGATRVVSPGRRR